MIPRISLLVLVFGVAPTYAELPEYFQASNQPIEPFRIADQLYYVGTNEQAVYLFTSDHGHILLDGGYPESVPLIRTSIEKLGFELTDIEILLNSHAHFDHSGGLAELKRLSGAQFIAARNEAKLLQSGGGPRYPFPPIAIDRLIDDNETVTLGPHTLTARITAGHTPGCTSWTTSVTDQGVSLATVFVCSVNAFDDMDLLTVDSDFPATRAAAFSRAFEILENTPCELFLGSHASFFSMKNKLEAQAASGSRQNPWIDPDLYRRHIADKKKRFEDLLASQQQP